MIFKLILALIISSAAAVLGRLGGSASGNRLFRILGIPSCIILMIVCILPIKWSLWLVVALALTFGAVLGATSTYFKGKNKPALWWNFALVGLVEGLALLPFVIVYHHWSGYFFRTVICALLVCLWDVLIGIDWLEEGGRYFIIVLSMLFLLL